MNEKMIGWTSADLGTPLYEAYQNLAPILMEILADYGIYVTYTYNDKHQDVGLVFSKEEVSDSESNAYFEEKLDEIYEEDEE
jgi:predicted RND superfamily exporter protein